MRVKRVAAAVVCGALAFALSSAAASADTGSVLALCYLNSAPLSENVDFDIDLPPVVVAGAHYDVPVTIGMEVTSEGELTSAMMRVTGAVLDDPAGPADVARLLPAAPGDDFASGTVGMTPIPGATSVRISIGTSMQPYIAPVAIGCTTPVVVRSWIDAVPPANDPTVSIGDVTGAEGTLGPARALAVPVTLSSPSTSEVAVDVFFDGGSATPGLVGVGDIAKQPVKRTVRFKPSLRTGLTPTTKFVSVRVYPDAQVEPDETAAFNLANPTNGYAIARGHGTATIRDDDSVSGVALSVRDLTVVEGATGKRTVKSAIDLSEPLTQDIMIDIGVQGDAPGSYDATCAIVVGPAVPPTGPDCRQWNKRVKLRAGLATKNIAVDLYPDTTLEFDEHAAVVVSVVPPVPASVVVVSNTGTLTILDDD